MCDILFFRSHGRKRQHQTRLSKWSLLIQGGLKCVQHEVENMVVLLVDVRTYVDAEAILSSRFGVPRAV